MPLNLSIPELTELKPRISVVGVGGAGGNAVNNMIESSLEGVEFVVANTDAQALGLSKADKKIQLGAETTQGLGAGSLPQVGGAAAEESIDEILEHIGNAHMLFITAGMGGGTGTGAAPVIAQAAKERDILTVGVVTKPFHFEGARRMKIASAGIDALQQHVDTLLIIPNQNLFSIANERTTFHEAFALADQVLHSGVRGITDLMVMPGLINLDFNDVRTVMSEMGKAMMGTGEAEGDKRAIEAAEAAISNPLLDEVSMKGAKGVLINITGSMDMTLFEVDEAANRIRAEVDPEANIIVGSTFNQDLEGKVRVSVVATGIEAAAQTNPSYSSSRQSMSVSMARPWRDGAAPAGGAVATADNPTPEPTAAPAPAAVSTGAPLSDAPRVDQPQAAPSEPVSAPAVATGADANPVGDVHERIRRMLTEGPRTQTEANPFRTPEAPTGSPAQASSTATQAGEARSTAPTAGGIGAGIGAAARGVLKSMAAPRRQEAPAAPQAPAQAETPAVQSAPAERPVSSGDLFDDDADKELEIPSFLRKKRVS
ncbi:MAG: cell division protein FtsZ [Pseudomonadota bacterium]